MRQKNVRLVISAGLCAALVLASCAGIPPAAPSPSLSPALSVPPSQEQPSPSPDMPYTVKTDYSQLTPYAPPEEVYTRLSPDFMPELVPSANYGPLLPYEGAVVDSGLSFPLGHDQGLVTLEGKIVMDAVCYEISKPSYYDNYDNASLTYPNSSVYILKKAVEKDIDGHTYGIPRYAVCTRDGRWATGFAYTYVICCDQVMLLFRDLKTNDFDAMDYSGKILYNSKALACYAQLRNYSLHKGDGPTPMDIGGGTIALWDYDGKIPCAFLKETSGDLATVGSMHIRAFSEGLAAAEKDGLLGYIDSSLSFVIPPQFTYCGKFKDGKAIVCLPGDEYAVIDTHGTILLKSAIRVRLRSGFYMAGGTEDRPAYVYGKNMDELIKPKDTDFWSTFEAGYACIKDGVTTILSSGAITTLPGEYQVLWLDGGYILCADSTTPGSRLMTLSGAPVAAFDRAYSSFSILRGADGSAYFALNDTKGNKYIIVNSQGRTVSAGSGKAAAVDGTALFEVKADQFFAYMDTAGRVIFLKSLLDSIPD